MRHHVGHVGIPKQRNGGHVGVPLGIELYSYAFFLFWLKNILIAFIAVAPMGKASFVYSYMQTRLLKGVNTMENDPLASFMC